MQWFSCPGQAASTLPNNLSEIKIHKTNFRPASSEILEWDLEICVLYNPSCDSDVY